MTNRRATIRDVAKRAGVAVSTASNAFNNKQMVAPETRQRILRAAEDLHFTPNALIRSLQRGRTNAVGVCTWPVVMSSDSDDGITMGFLKGVTDGLAKANKDLLLYLRSWDRNGEALVTAILDGRADGVVIMPHCMSEGDAERIAHTNLPTVFVYDNSLAALKGTVTIDNRGGVSAAVDHLVALGHRRIGFYAPLFSYDFRERQAGYRAGLERNGIEFDAAICTITLNYEFSAIPPACDRLLALPEPPTALIAGDDAIAFRWIDALQERGVRVPEDFSIVGFDDSPRARQGSGLTTVRQSAEGVGQAAAELLQRMIDGAPVSECQTILPVELMVRSTTAAPRPR